MYAAEGPGYGAWGGTAREAAEEAAAREAAEGTPQRSDEMRGRGYYCFKTRAAARACFEALAAGGAAAGEGEGTRGAGGDATVAVAAVAAAAPSQQQAISVSAAQKRPVEAGAEQASKRPAAEGAAGAKAAAQAAADTAAAERAAAEAKVATERLRAVQRKTAEGRGAAAVGRRGGEAEEAEEAKEAKEAAGAGRQPEEVQGALRPVSWMESRPGHCSREGGEAMADSVEGEGAATLAAGPTAASAAAVAASGGGKAGSLRQLPAPGSRLLLPLATDDIEETDVEDEDQGGEENEEEDEDEEVEEGWGEEAVGEERLEGGQDAQEQQRRSGGGSGLALFGFGAGRHGVSQQAGRCMACAWHVAWHVHGILHGMCKACAKHLHGISMASPSRRACRLLPRSTPRCRAAWRPTSPKPGVRGRRGRGMRWPRLSSGSPPLARVIGGLFSNGTPLGSTRAART